MTFLGYYAGVIAAGCLLGAWFGYVGWGLIVALASLLAATLYRLYQLDLTITEERKVLGLDTYGLWAELHSKIEKLRAKSRARKRRYVALLREIRESTGALNDAGVILNEDHEIVWFNRAARKILGLSRRSDIGQRIDNLIRHPDFIAYLSGEHDGLLTIPSPVSREGTLALQLIPYGNGQLVLMVRDVTSEMQLARTRRDFVANASHELRSPLTVVAGYLDTLAFDSDIPPDWRIPVDEMMRQVERMKHLLRDLIELTKLESADEPAAYEWVDTEEILERIVAELRARQPTQEIAVQLASDLGILGSESEIYSVFYNLMSNAQRYTAADGRISVTWAMRRQGAEFVVRDTGIGIPADMISRLTERFYRVDTGRSRAAGGTGLGLAIVKHALIRHEAKLEIESVEGQGSTFSCVFPPDRVARRHFANRNGL